MQALGGLALIACALGALFGGRPASPGAPQRASVGIVRHGAATPFATGVLVARDLVLTVRHATHVHRGGRLRHAPRALDVVVGTGPQRRRYPVVAFAYTSERVDLALIRIGPSLDGSLPSPRFVSRVAVTRHGLGTPLLGVHRARGGPERRDVVDVVLPFEADADEVAYLLGELPHDALRRALRQSYRRDSGGRLHHFSTRWAGQPTLGVSPFADEGSSGAPLFDETGHIAGILFAGDPASSRARSGWLRHEAVLPAAVILSELRGTAVGDEIGIARQTSANSGS